MIADREIPIFGIEEGRTIMDAYFSLFVPGKGQINPYTYEAELEDLRKNLLDT